jgi:vitamin B12 transporter
MRKFIFIIWPGLLISTVVLAQDSTKTTFLQEVVVSASRSEQPIIDIPRSVSVIRREVIEKSIYQSLGDLLNAQSGLYVVGANQTPGTNQNIFMRGTNSNQVAVLIDGVRITDPSSPNSAIDLSEVSLVNVERVEVIRGSHSTMSGGAAIGGVINIITKNNSTPGFHGSGAWQGGTFGKRTFSSVENLDVGYAFKGGIYFNGGLFQQDVQGLDASEKDARHFSFTSDKDDFKKTDAFFKAGYKNKAWEGFIAFKNAHQLADIDNGAFLDDDNSHLRFDRKLLTYHVGYKLNDRWRTSLLGSWSGSARSYENDSSRTSADGFDHSYSSGTYHGNLQTHEAQINYEANKVKGVFGGGFYLEKMSFDTYFLYNEPTFPFESRTNYDTLDTKTTTQYVFGQLSYSAGAFNLSAGSRLSHHSTFGDYVTFEVNPSVRVGDWLLYGSVSTGYNAPSLYQLYDPTKSFSAYTTRGKQTLRAEESLSLEVGVKKEFSGGTYLTVSAYETSVDNAIEYIYLWNGATPVDALDYTDDRGDTYMNVAHQQTRGVELEGFARISEKISFKGNITALHGEIEVNGNTLDLQQTGGNHVQLYNLGTFLDQDVQQKNLVRRPALTSFAQLSIALLPAVVLTASHRYTGSRFDSGYDQTLGPYGALDRIEVDGYHLVDLGIHWEATKVFGVGLKVENILNEEYREVAGFHTRGRSGYLKLTARW